MIAGQAAGLVVFFTGKTTVSRSSRAYLFQLQLAAMVDMDKHACSSLADESYKKKTLAGKPPSPGSS